MSIFYFILKVIFLLFLIFLIILMGIASNNNRDRYTINEDDIKNNSDFVKKEL